MQVSSTGRMASWKASSINILAMSRITIRVDELAGLGIDDVLDDRPLDEYGAEPGRRTHDALGRDGLRRAHREGDERSGADVVFRRRLGRLLPHVSAARESRRRGEHGDGDVSARGDEPSVARTYELDADIAPHDPGRGRSRARRPVVRHDGRRSRAAASPSARCISATNPIWKGGHESLGETAPSTTWFLAEGATGAGFDTFILVANPNAEPVDVTYTFLSDSAGPATITRTIPGLSRHHGQHRSGRAVASGRSGGDADQRDASGDRRARAVLAAVVRSAGPRRTTASA